MRHLHPGIGRHSGQRPELVGNEIFEIIRAHADLPAPEAPEVVEAGMRPDGDPVRLRLEADIAHHRGIAAMHAAGDIDALHDLQDLVVIADFIVPVALAHIGIDIDTLSHDAVSLDPFE